MTEETPTTQDFIYNLAATPDFGRGKGGICFAAHNTGLFRSDNNGQTWVDATASLQLSATVAATAVALPIDYVHNHIILAGMAGGVLRSTDGGQTWQIPKLPTPPPMVTALALSPNFSADGVVMVGTMEDGVLSSNDSGYSWTSWNFGLLDLTVLCLALSPNYQADETAFVGTETGIFRSTNGGRAWREVTLPIGYEPVISLAISPTYASDHTLFAGTDAQGILVSHDEGDTWQQLGDAFNSEPVNSIIVSPEYVKTREIVVLSNGLAWHSHDAGSSWTQLWADISTEGSEISALYTAASFTPGSPAWLGLYGGEIRAVHF